MKICWEYKNGAVRVWKGTRKSGRADLIITGPDTEFFFEYIGIDPFRVKDGVSGIYESSEVISVIKGYNMVERKKNRRIRWR